MSLEANPTDGAPLLGSHSATIATASPPPQRSKRPQAMLALAALWMFLCLSFYGQPRDPYASSSPSGDGDADPDAPRKPRRFYFDQEGDEDDAVPDDGVLRDDPSLPPPKTILYFTSFFDMADFEFGFGRSAFVRHGCPVSNCVATNNRSMLASIADFDAVIFHLIEMRKNNKFIVPNQKRRRRNQRYVMFLMEAPSEPESFPYRALKGFFNWTMTYRLDSDVPRPYGWTEPLGQSRQYSPRLSDDTEWLPYDRQAFMESLPSRSPEFRALALKPKLVAWIVSNCQTRSDRESYVRQLRKFVPVDVMGACGDARCDQAHRSRADNCSAVVDAQYKFYLSFENSLCDQYTTEKFWRRLAEPVLPVVMGGGRFSAVAPPHSHLNVEDFASPKALAERLLFLDQNPAEYLSYFWWKDHYRAVNSRRQRATAMCDLCRKLHDAAEPEAVVDDLQEWWWGRAHCVPKGDAPWSSPWSASWLGSLMQGASGKI